MRVHLADDLAAAATEAGIDLDAAVEAAVRQAVAAASNDAWLATLRPVPPQVITHQRALGALDAVRWGAPTRHG